MGDTIYQDPSERITLCINNHCVVPVDIKRYVAGPMKATGVYSSLEECLTSCKPPVQPDVESYAIANLNTRDKPHEKLSPAFLPMIWGNAILQDQEIDPFLANIYQ